MSGPKKLMGTMHSSKPVLPSDKAMSDRHIANRAKIDDKPHTPDNLRRSIVYNRQHSAEHEKAAKDNEKELKKSAKDNEKERKK